MLELCSRCFELESECVCWHCEQCYSDDEDKNMGWYMYDEHHGKPCERCCAHDQGWWQLGEGYGYDNDMYACRAGCGDVRLKKELQRKGERLFTTQSKDKREAILRSTAEAQGKVLPEQVVNVRWDVDSAFAEWQKKLMQHWDSINLNDDTVRMKLWDPSAIEQAIKTAKENDDGRSDDD